MASRTIGRMLLAALLAGAGTARAADSAAPLGAPVLDRPTLHSLGVYWIVRGDENRNAAIRLEYRQAGTLEWRQGPDLFRVARGVQSPSSKLEVPADAWLFAGSALLLEPDTAYEIRLTLRDPDTVRNGTDISGDSSAEFTGRTIAEPVAPSGPVYHVVPGNGGGSGTQADPYQGLEITEENAKPGDTFLLHTGAYQGAVTLRKSGEKDKPIVWRGAGDGEAVIDAKGQAAQRPERGIQAVGLHDRWFENLTIRNARHGIVAHETGRLVLRRCHIHQVDFGLTATRNSSDGVNDFFIVDNVIEGPSTWPRTQGIEDARGIQLSGSGHVVAYNRIRAFGDAIDTFQDSPRCDSIDFHNNDLSELTDDGIELDYSTRNVRCFYNRLTNVYQGISTQPVYGGPAYVFRNVMYNVCVEPFKMHNSPSGAIMVHNTVVKKGEPMSLQSGKGTITNCVYRNNLFVGTGGRYAFACETKTVDCDFDYDGFGGGPYGNFLKWNNIRYRTLEEVKAKAGIYKHAVEVDPAAVFASGALPPSDENQQASVADLRLATGTPAIDAGQALPGFSDGFSGKAPDLGAHELNAPLPHYGPRPAKP